MLSSICCRLLSRSGRQRHAGTGQCGSEWKEMDIESLKSGVDRKLSWNEIDESDTKF
jgi:hypothetical protein